MGDTNNLYNLQNGMEELEKFHRERLNDKVAREVQEWKSQGIDNMEQQRKIKDYYQWGTTKFYEHVLIPIHSEEIKKELKEGPPKGLTKAEQKAWTAHHKNLQGMALRREEFFRITENIREWVNEKLEGTEALIMKDGYNIAHQMVKEIKIDTGKLLKDHGKMEQNTEEELLKVVEELKTFMVSMNDFMPEDINGLSLKELITRYQNLETKLQAVCGNGAGMLRRQQLERLELSEDTYAGYLFLNYGVSSMLVHALEQFSVNKVNAHELAKLKGMAAAFGIIAAKTEINSSFQEKVKNARKIRENTELKEGIKLQESEEKIALTTEVLQDYIDNQEYSGEIKEALKEALKKKVITSNKTMNIQMDLFLDEVKENMKIFETNYSSLKNKLEIELRKNLGFITNNLCEELLKNLTCSNITELLKELKEEERDKLPTINLKGKDMRMEELIKRKNYLANNPKSPYLRRISEKNLLKIESIQELITAPNTYSEFEQQVIKLENQVSYNVVLTDDFLKDKLSPLTRKKVFDYLVEHNGAIIVFGNFVQIWNMLEHFLKEVLPKECPGLMETEEKLHLIIKKLGLNKKYAYRNLPEEESGQEESELTKLKERLQANEDYFNKKMAMYEFPGSKWKAILSVKKEELDKSTKEFQEKLENEISKEDFVRMSLISLEEYLEEQGEEEKEIDISYNYSNQGLLRYNLLCKWEGFEGAFSGLEDIVLKELGKLLKKGSFRELFPFMENINSLEDMEALTFTELSLFANQLRLNIGKGFSSWQRRIVAVKRDIWMAVIPDMLSGTLTEENIDKCFEQISQEKGQYKYIKQFRLRHALRKEFDSEGLKLNYNHMDETASSRLVGKNSRVENRLARFKTASEIWEVLKENEKKWEAIKIISKMGSASGSGAGIHKEICNLMRQISFKKTMTVKTAKLCKRFEEEKIKQEDYVDEFRLCGMESFLLDKKHDKEGYQKFTGAKKDDGYKEMLRKKGEMVTRRINDLNNVITEVYRNRSFTPSLNLMLIRVGPFIAGLRDEKEAEEENYERYGVRNWREAIAVIKDDLMLSMLPLGDVRLVFEGLYLGYEKILKQRKNYLQHYKDGILASMIPLLLENEDVWKSMLLDSTPAFKEKAEIWYNKLKEPLSLLQNSFSYGENFVRQLLEDKGEELLLGETKEKAEWINIFRNYFVDYCEHKVAGYSIRDELEKLNNKNPIIAGYMTELLMTDPRGLELITSKGKYKDTLKMCEECVEPNTRALDDYLKNLTEPLNTAEETGFRMFLRSKVLSVKPVEFAPLLPNLLQEFRKLQEKKRLLALESIRAMEEKDNIYRKIEFKKNLGKEADKKDGEKIKELRSLMVNPGSFLLSALGVKKIPSPGEINQAEKKLAVYRDSASYGKLSPAVEACLFEILLSKKEEKIITGELKWLVEVDKQIRTIKFNGENKPEEDVIRQFLTFLYIRRTGGKATNEILTEEEIRKEFHILANRRFKLGRLRNQSQEKHDLKLNGNEMWRSDGLATKRRIVSEALSVGLFTIGEEEEFDALLTRQVNYLENAKKADEVFRELIEKYGKENTDLTLLRLGLLDYFQKEILEGSSLKEIRDEAISLLTDENTYKVMTESVRMGTYGQEKNISLEGMGSTGLSIEERKISLSPSRETLENFLAEKHNDKYRKAYNRLDKEQRQVFALMVFKSGLNTVFPSTEFVRSSSLEEIRQRYAKTCIEQYMEGKNFYPEIFYERVMEILRKEDGRMNEEVFSHCMEETILAIKRRKDNQPREMARLSDAKNSILAAKAYVKEAKEEVKEAATLSEWKEILLSYDSKVKGKGYEIKQRFSKMDNYQLPLLVAILQDRTILDYSLTLKKEGERRYVNEKERENVKNQLLQGKGPRIVTASIMQAMTNLRSYQLRDDVELINHKLAKEEFAPGALERNTMVDWELLGRAMDFLRENFV